MPVGPVHHGRNAEEIISMSQEVTLHYQWTGTGTWALCVHSN
jgi:hypothetical protein